jgi:hypothetical protein
MAYQGNNGSGKPNVVLAYGLDAQISERGLDRDVVLKSMKRHEKKFIKGARNFGELEKTAWERTKDNYFIPAK